MVRYRRNLVPGGTFFFTLTLADRASNALTAHIDELRAAFRTARAARPFVMDAIVVLPDHLHALLTLPDDDVDFPTRWRHVKTLFTRAVLARGVSLDQRDSTGRILWQRRFWEHTIRDGADFTRHVDYIHFNPVKHGFVSKPTDWPHSSLNAYIKRGIVPPDWATAPGNDDWFGE